MANPHKRQWRREAINEDREWTHETAETEPHDRSAGNSQVRGEEWRRRHGIEGESQHDDGGDRHHHHHHHHHHHGDSEQTDRDYERMAEHAHAAAEETTGTGSQSGRTGTDSGLGSHREQGQQQGDERRYGQRREQRGRESHQYGTVPEGSQRGSRREEGIAGRMTGQRGETTHHANPSDTEFRDETMGEREHRHGGERGTSGHDHRFGTRRGHGSQRRTERRHSSH